MTEDELLKKGAELGLKPRYIGDEKTKERYIKDIVAREKIPVIRQEQLQRKSEKLSKRGRFDPRRRRLTASEQAELDSYDNNNKPKLEGSELPYYRDDANQANYALRVFVVNQESGGSGVIKSLKVDIPKNPDGTTRWAEEPEEEDYTNTGLNTYNKSGKGLKGTSLPGFLGASGTDSLIALVDKPFQAMNIKGAMALRVFDQSNIILAQAMEKKIKADSSAVGMQQKLISSPAFSMGIKMIKKEAASPVYVVNKSLNTDVGKLLLGFLDVFLKFIPGGRLVAAELKSLAGQTDAIDGMLSMIGFSTGGKGKALPRYAYGTKNSNVSSFIAGDSMNGKPNEEQVNINWNKRSFEVKPIPSMTTQEMTNTGVSSATRMSAAERNEPMKVYAVNPGITDMVEIGGGKASLIGLVVDITSRLASIEGLLSIGNQQGVAIAAATSATASNVGKLASKSNSMGSNPFANGFPSDLDSILTGR